MYRFRQSPNLGCTRESIKACERHHNKLGEIKSIKGYTYSSNGILRNGVLIKGSKGSMRLSSLGWGYSGEGPRGLEKVLKVLDVTDDEIKRVLSMPWHGWSKVEQSWVINIP